MNTMNRDLSMSMNTKVSPSLVSLPYINTSSSKNFLHLSIPYINTRFAALPMSRSLMTTGQTLSLNASVTNVSWPNSRAYSSTKPRGNSCVYTKYLLNKNGGINNKVWTEIAIHQIEVSKIVYKVWTLYCTYQCKVIPAPCDMLDSWLCNNLEEKHGPSLDLGDNSLVFPTPCNFLIWHDANLHHPPRPNSAINSLNTAESKFVIESISNEIDKRLTICYEHLLTRKAIFIQRKPDGCTQILGLSTKCQGYQ